MSTDRFLERIRRRTGWAWSAVLLALATGAGAHVDSPLLLEECGSCHVGHGLSGQPMLGQVEENVCFRCHGGQEARSREMAEGRLAGGAQLEDVEAEFRKLYHHPVLEGTGHSPVERLDGGRMSEVRHSECVDCHDPHQRVAGGLRSVDRVSGLTLSGEIIEESVFEYQVCLKCHGDRPVAYGITHTLREEFGLEARSQHPVTRDPSGREMPSVLPHAANRRLLCSDCHGSDDPDGPRGPHGSRHEFLLRGNYDTGIYAEESPLAFELCYGCHDRESILSDESFPLHSLHIQGDPLAGTRGTSCFTCHASHGSPSDPSLVRFNSDAVAPGGPLRQVQFLQMGERSGECSLSCHGHDHTPGVYR